MFNFFKRTRHRHDWEVIEVSKAYYKKRSDNYTWYKTPEAYIRHGRVPSDSLWATNRVCLYCGKCDNQVAEAKAQIRKRKLERRRRKMWAKQLWEDGCKDQR